MSDAIDDPIPTDTAKAQMKAAEVDGRLYRVSNGTRAEVLKEVLLTDVKGMSLGVSLMRVRIRNGPRSGELGFCFSSVAQPDKLSCWRKLI